MNAVFFWYFGILGGFLGLYSSQLLLVGVDSRHRRCFKTSVDVQLNSQEPPLREIKGITKNLCDTDLAELSGDLSGLICLETFISLSAALEVKRPLWTKSGKRPILAGPLAKRPIKAMVLVGISVRSVLMGWFSGTPAMSKNGPSKKAH